MKISTEHYEFIKNKIKENYNGAQLELNRRHLARSMGLSWESFVWDILCTSIDLVYFVLGNLYNYLNATEVQIAVGKVISDIIDESEVNKAITKESKK